MAKIFDIFKKSPPKEVKPIIEPESKVTIINPENFLTIENIAPRIANILKGSVDFNKWGFSSHLFLLRGVTMNRKQKNTVRVTGLDDAMVVAAFCSMETHEVRLFDVSPFVNEIMKEGK